jgi:hypothetical protein
LHREELIALAYFLGCDYTEGVNGIGIVNAAEIVRTFPVRTAAEDSFANCQRTQDCDQSGRVPDIINGLQKFREWLEGYDFSETVRSKNANNRKHDGNGGGDGDSYESAEENTRDAGNEAKSQPGDDNTNRVASDFDASTRLFEFGKAHKGARARWSVRPNFPDSRVAEAFLKPMANTDSTTFKWSVPKLHRIRAYCREFLGWSDAHMDAQVDPVIQRYASRSSQARIDSYFLAYHDDSRVARFNSERLKTAVQQIAGKRIDIAGQSKVKKRVSASQDVADTGCNKKRATSSIGGEDNRFNGSVMPEEHTTDIVLDSADLLNREVDSGADSGYLESCRSKTHRRGRCTVSKAGKVVRAAKKRPLQSQN